MAVTGNVNVSTTTRLELFEEWFTLKNLKRKACFGGLLEAIFTGSNASGYNIEGILEIFIKNIEKRNKKQGLEIYTIISELGLQEKCSKKLRLDPEALQMLKAPKIRSNTNSDSE